LRNKKLIGKPNFKKNSIQLVPTFVKKEFEINLKSTKLFFSSASFFDAKAMRVFSKRLFITIKRP